MPNDSYENDDGGDGEPEADNGGCPDMEEVGGCE